MRKFLEKVTKWQIVIGLQAIVSAATIFFVFRLGVLPIKYFAALCGVLVLLLVLMFFFAKDPKSLPKHAKKPIRPLIGRIVSLLLSIVLVIGCAAIARGDGVFSSISKDANVKTTTFQVIVLDSSDYEDIDDLEGKTIGTVPNVNADKFKTAKAALNKEVNYTEKEYSEFQTLGNDLYSKSIDAIFVDSAYSALLENYHPTFEGDTRVIWSYDIDETVKDTASDKDVTSQAFTVLISGVDSRSSKISATSRSDVNMLVTVNPNTKQVLMTSIPRDYYVTLANAGKKDKLTHAGLFGVQNSVETIENFMGVDIDYYAKVNFVSLEKIVDALGGITVYSDQAFTAYNDHSVKIPKGNVKMNGKMALHFSRERYAYKSGDRHRAENQQAVLKAIIKKMASPSILTGYNSIMSAVEDYFQTNMSEDSMKALVNMQLSKNISWDFQSYILEGTGKLMTGGYMMPSTKLYYMVPNESSISTAAQYIKDMESDKTIKVSE